MELAFRAFYDNGVVCEWHKPWTFRQAFKRFKLVAQYEECHGELYCNNILIRETGRKDTQND